MSQSHFLFSLHSSERKTATQTHQQIYFKAATFSFLTRLRTEKGSLLAPKASSYHRLVYQTHTTLQKRTRLVLPPTHAQISQHDMQVSPSGKTIFPASSHHQRKKELPKQLPLNGMNILQAVAIGSSAEMRVLMITSSTRNISAANTQNSDQLHSVN